jgi:hypothetical protein
MLNPYTTVALFAPQGEPSPAAKFREEYDEERSGPATTASEPERPFVRRDPMLLARIWVQIGRFGRVA